MDFVGDDIVDIMTSDFNTTPASPAVQPTMIPDKIKNWLLLSMLLSQKINIS